MKRNKFLKYVIWGSGTVIIGILLFFIMMFFGNPISSSMAKMSAQQYIKEQYPSKDYKIERVAYNFKDGNYYVHIKSESSIDTAFALIYNGLGKFLRDDYEYRVVQGQNTYERLNRDYRKLVDGVIQSDSFKYKDDVFIGYGDLILEDEKSTKDSSMIPTLELDKTYDYQKLGKACGEICIYIGDDQEGLQGEKALLRTKEILLAIKEVFDTSGVTFNKIDFVLYKPAYGEDGSTYIGDNLVNIEDFLYEQICEDGLYERIKQNHEALTAYYHQEDLKIVKQLKA